ncbi:HAMP domain-containing sensor histidine kinase [Streptomyces sp. NPDC047315]|uniref:sensor histidine kinase n=1 Tax=Streptomyces sp. NPDC047315 TaxID=3155142 RepID=UPI0033E0F222
MSFRLRVIGLLVIVAVAAAGSGTWVTWRHATAQVADMATADVQKTNMIADSLKQYGYSHGTWQGVAPRVLQLSKDTGQRIRVTTGKEVVVADSDVLSGREPRAVSPRPAAVVDPLPHLVMEYDRTLTRRVSRTTEHIAAYRVHLTFVQCLTREGLKVVAVPNKYGMPVVRASLPAAVDCRRPEVPPPARSDQESTEECGDEPRYTLDDCLRLVFRESVKDSSPQRVEVYLGVGNPTPPKLSGAPVAGLAGGVAVVVALAAVLLTRTVLRPVRTLTAATSSLGQGDLGRRVPVEGRDEIARLGRAFNRMAGSIQAGEERQRRLTGDVAHELRTPLANIRGYVEAFQDGYLEPTPELLASLHEEVMLQQRIVDDLQDLALAEAGALTYHFSAVDLGELLETCRIAHRARAEEAGVRLEVSTGGRPVAVGADPYRLRQAVGNLVSNAVRATSPGGAVTLELAEDGEHALVRVRDTGAGIPQEHLPHLFDRFWRGDASRGRRTGGSGLGLSIVRQIVRDHGGWVDVASTVGEGTTFTVTLERL